MPEVLVAVPEALVAVPEALEGKDYQHKKIKMQTHWKNTSPATPFYAVIFVSQKSEDLEGYQAMDELMMAEAQKQPGYLGYSSANEAKGGIFISYWQNQESIENWRQHAGHLQAKGQATRWYHYFHSLICEVKSHKEFLSESKFLG